MRVTSHDLEAINRALGPQKPAEIINWVWSTFGRRAALLSSMQKAGAALCHMAELSGAGLDVLFVDTGVLHQQTLATRDELARTHRHLAVITLHPARSMAEQTRDEGLLYLTREGQERCCELRKSEPLRAVRGRYDAIMSSLRRAEGGARATVKVLELDSEMNALRVHPFVGLTSEELDAYVVGESGVVINPLHYMGFATIGCFTCTTPVREGEPERAGRWRHLASVEYCGINPSDRGASRDAVVDLDDRYREALMM